MDSHTAREKNQVPGTEKALLKRKQQINGSVGGMQRATDAMQLKSKLLEEKSSYARGLGSRRDKDLGWCFGVR